MDLFPSIQELLFEADCVVVPGFGAFLGIYAPAHLHREEGLIYPPSKKIAFNRQLHNNDGALAYHLSNRTGIPFQEASELVNAWGKHADQLLLTQGEIVFPEIGIIRYDKAQEAFRFDAFAQINYLPSSFGLEPLPLLAVEKPTSGLREFEHVRDYKPVPPLKGKFRRLQTRKRRWATAALAMLILLLWMGGLGLRNWQTQEAGVAHWLDTLHPVPNNSEKAPVVVHPEVQKSKPAPKTETPDLPVHEVVAPVPAPKKETAKVRKAIQAAQPAVQKSPKTVETPVLSQEGYFVVVGAFSVEDNALRLEKKLQKDFPGRSIRNKRNKQLHVISIYAGNQREEAGAFLSANAGAFPGAWISK